MKVVPPAGQLAATHDVPWLYFWQAPAAHLPLVPQLAAPWSLHPPAGSGVPVGTSVQAPSEPESAHERHDPVQAVAQQMAAAPAPAAVAAPAPAPAAEVDIVASLTKLAALRDAGALSDAEFDAAKARLLA